MLKDDDLGVFTQLGLTNRQAEVYIAISKLGQATVKSIAKTAQTDRAEIYRTVPKLQEFGIVKKIIATPISFKAIPLAEGLSILLERNAEKHEEIRAEAEQFLKDFKNQNRKKPSKESPQYCLTLGKAVKRDLRRDLSETQTSKDCILDWKVIISMISEDFEYFKEALERGVKLRFITHVPEGEKMSQIIQNLTEQGSFEIKSASSIPRAMLDIFDKKLVHVIIIPNSDLKKIEVLRSDNLALVDLVQDYFEFKWQSATTLDSIKNDH